MPVPGGSSKSRSRRTGKWRARRCRLTVALAILLGAGLALAQTQEHPLAPPDRSSPRTMLKSFLHAGDTLAAFLAREYLPAPSRARFHRLISLSEITLQFLDLSDVPPAAREKTGRAAALALYEILNRLSLAPFDQIPDVAADEEVEGSEPVRWVIPNTEIVLVAPSNGPDRSVFRFSAETVARVHEFHERIRARPHVRLVPIENIHELVTTGGGWMIPYSWIQSFPASLRAPILYQSGWKWVGVALILVALVLFLSIAYRVSQLGRQESPFQRALAQFAMPSAVLAATPAVAYLALVQLNLTGVVGSVVELAATAVVFLAGAWMAWRLAPVVAEAIIASPRIATESIDAHLIRVTARMLGILGGMSLIAVGADRLGVPVYGIVAGLGVGGLAIALAAQPSIENLLGGLSLFADKPVRVGDLCRYGDALGTVEAIGIRSARIRGLDRTLTTIPNAALARMPITNFTQRDSILIRDVVGLRYETTPEQLRYVLVKLRELLSDHPRILPQRARVQFVGLGGSSLDIELFAYVTTNEWEEFLGIREEILLRVMDIVEQGGTSFAFPSQTLYFGRDHGLDERKARAAEASVRVWREEGVVESAHLSAQREGADPGKHR
jgi:MscS family membrane protein